MIILKIRLTEGKHQVNKTENTLPRDLYHAAWALHKAFHNEAGRDFFAALYEHICPTCRGEMFLGVDARIKCPPCNGTGWKDGQDPTEIEE